MGWSILSRAPLGGMKAHLDGIYAEGAQLLESAIVGGAYYAAVKLPDGRVIAGVALIEGNGYKLMDESCGPYANECPPEILGLLSPAASPFAQAWRDRCAAYNRDQDHFEVAA